MRDKRQEIGSDCYGTKIGPHEGEQSSQFVHSGGVCRDVVLSVLMLEESWAKGCSRFLFSALKL